MKDIKIKCVTTEESFIDPLTEYFSNKSMIIK
jgi:hypothetical protein